MCEIILKHDSRNTIPMVKLGISSIMLWGIRRALTSCKTEGRMDGAKYRKILVLST
uniref:Uncharacterized protein n=1 Tax=Anguilla anguilla TaxID=7936 RepID=A0A0E9WLZ7_ANGAN